MSYMYSNKLGDRLELTMTPDRRPSLRIFGAEGGVASFQFSTPAQVRVLIEELSQMVGTVPEGVEVKPPTSEDVIRKMHADNEFELRMWKEGYSEGYGKGFDAGREYQLEQ